LALFSQDKRSACFNCKQDIAFGPLNGYTLSRQKLVDEALKTVGMTEFKEKPLHFLSLGAEETGCLGILPCNRELLMDEPTLFDPLAASDIMHCCLVLTKKESPVLAHTRLYSSVNANILHLKQR
jgi:energy-coupling factor transporter ATP-binding protein EcfA2